jgi:replicative DNA helicase
MFVYRPEYYYKAETSEHERNMAYVIIGKQRNGPTGDAQLVFSKEFTRFDNRPEDDPGHGGRP